jgi:glycosyltransferase involved in cell wall biosynthesis
LFAASKSRKTRSVLLLTHFFTPEPCAAANRAVALRAALEEAGFAVHVVTGVATFPTGTIEKGEYVAWTRTERIGSSALTRVRTFASERLTPKNRIMNWLSVSIAASIFVIAMPRRFEIVIATMPPITLALPALCAKLRHRAKDVAIKMGHWSEGSRTARLVGWIARLSYSAASLVICVTESARGEILARGSEPAKTILAPNGFDPIAFAETSPYERLPGEFVAAFVGNMGLATGLDIILDAAALLLAESPVRFVLAGGGADGERLALRVANEGLKNVTMVGVIPRPAANALIKSADVCIVPLHRSLLDSLPTKLFDALVIGCPVICCANGEASAFVKRSGGGYVVEPENGPALASSIRSLMLNPAERNRLAEAGRAYVLANYDRSSIMRGVADLLARS